VGDCIGGSANGIGTNAKFDSPSYLALNPTGSLMFVADSSNNEIRIIALKEGNTLFVLQ
jgi:hypothetical protein